MKDKKLFLELDNGIRNEYQIELIKGMCDKAKMYAIDYLLNKKENVNSMCDLSLNYEIYNPELSPIEQIFQVVYYQYVNELWFWQKENINCINEQIPTHYLFMEELESQKEILYKDKKYVADFVIDFSKKCVGGKLKGEYVYPTLSSLKYVIELDGYEYHSKKHQMNYDYERENNLKELGYTVVRFTGSQVYKEPYTCVDKLISIIFEDSKRKTNREE